MARSYTITFVHKNKTYTAVIAELQQTISVYIPDEGLHHVLPHGRFKYDKEPGLNINGSSLTLQQNLMLDVTGFIYYVKENNYSI